MCVCVCVQCILGVCRPLKRGSAHSDLVVLLYVEASEFSPELQHEIKLLTTLVKGEWSFSRIIELFLIKNRTDEQR